MHAHMVHDSLIVDIMQPKRFEELNLKLSRMLLRVNETFRCFQQTDKQKMFQLFI